MTVALAMGGCATQSGTQRVAGGQASLEAAPSCCVSLADAQRKPLPVEPVLVPIDPTAQVFEFDGRKSYFLLFELPAYASPYSVRLTSEVAGTARDVAIFVPRVVLYDKDFAVTRSFDEKTLRNRGQNLERTVFVNPADARDRFLAIFSAAHSGPTERAYAEVTYTPVVAGPVIFSLVRGEEGKMTWRPSPVGAVRIETQDLVPVPRAK